MNPTKTKYARERAAAIRDGLIANLRSTYTRKGGDKTLAGLLTTKQLRAYYEQAIRDVLKPAKLKEVLKEVRIGEKTTYNYEKKTYKAEPCLEFPNLDHILNEMVKDCDEATKLRTESEARTAEFEAKCDEINNEHDRVMDLVVLGDEEAALNALQSFADFRV